MARKLKVPDHIAVKVKVPDGKGIALTRKVIPEVMYGKKDTGPPKAIADAIASGARPTVSQSQFETLKAKAKEARDLQKRIENGKVYLADYEGKYNKIVTDELPQLMDKMGVPSLVVEAEGNEPAFSARNNPFYSASLSRPKKTGQPDPRPEGFEYLKKIGHGDLIKQEVSFLFPVGTDPELVHKFIETAMSLGVVINKKVNLGTKKKPRWTTRKLKLEVPFPQVEEGVHANTLTAWLKRQVEQEKFVPNLSKIGGFLGRKVEIKTVELQPSAKQEK